MVKIKWILILTINVLLVLPSCSTRKPADSDLDFCLLRTQGVNTVASLIIHHKEQVKATSMRNEDCVNNVIDNLTNNPSEEHFEALEILASKSDGAVSEYMMDAAVRLLMNDTAHFLDFLNRNQQAILFQYLTDGLSMKLSVENTDKEDLKANFRQKLRSDQQIIMLDKVFNNVDPTRFN